jgi:sugar/nucleoside kinase (ribokinase family)
VVSLGEEGVCYASADRDDVGFIEAPRVAVVDTNGCGDVLHGAYAAALARGELTEARLRYGVAAAGIYAGRPGGWDHLPAHGEVATVLSRA